MNYYLQNIKSFSATAENPEALSGQGGRTNGGRKGSAASGDQRMCFEDRYGRIGYYGSYYGRAVIVIFYENTVFPFK